MAPRNTWRRSWWTGTIDPSWAGVAIWPGNREQWSQIFLDTSSLREFSEESRLRLITHELMHALGLNGHAPQDLDETTLMTPAFAANPEDAPIILFFVDHITLRGLYDPESLGDWARTRYQVFGCIRGTTCFGATGVMGDVEAHALGGPTPIYDSLANNPSLHGTATWRGRLLGLTPNQDVVGGAAALSVSLDHMVGGLSFTKMEQWAAGRTPGRVGTGTTWGDGDLRYGIVVTGNEFYQSRQGDEGLVTGIFTGRFHEGMAGVLERDDLAAGFGGKR